MMLRNAMALCRVQLEGPWPPVQRASAVALREVAHRRRGVEGQVEADGRHVEGLRAERLGAALEQWRVLRIRALDDDRLLGGAVQVHLLQDAGLVRAHRLHRLHGAL